MGKIYLKNIIILLLLTIAKTYAQNFGFPLANSGWSQSQDFGVENSLFGGYHLGEDYVSNNNIELPVYSVLDGTVKHVASHTDYGYVVVIEHTLNNDSKVCSVYGHMRAANITYSGKAVTKGELIGYLSNRSSENGGYPFTHLHFGIRAGSYSEVLDSDSKWRYRGYGPSSIRDLWYDGSEFIGSHQTTTLPILSGPANNSVHIKSYSFTFSWTSVTNAVYYEIWIDNNSAFGSPEVGYNNGVSPNWINNGIVSSNSFTLTTIMQNQLPQNLYSWKVRALDSNKNPITIFSDPRDFILLDNAPSPPSLSNPENNSEQIKGNNISFTWSSVSNASYYEIWIDNNSGFGSPEVGFNNGKSSNWVDDGIVNSSTFLLTTSMQNQLPQNLYYWKVRALDVNKSPLTDWSTGVLNFKLLDKPSPPILSTPTDNLEQIRGNNISFTWSSVSNASYYEIWIDNNGGFGSPEVGFNNGANSNWVNDGIVSSNTFILTTSMQELLPQNLYYWKVRALDSNKNPFSDWSTSVNSFSLLDQNNNTIITDELNGATLGNATGITYVATPNGQGAVFSRSTESRIEYPFSIGLPHEGTIEMAIKIFKGYTYNNYMLNDDQQNAYIFNTGPSDVWYLGAMWLVVSDNGDVSLSTALTSTPTSHSLSATNTTFRFNEWHVVSFSFGSQGQYLSLDGQVVASNPSYTETLQACGDWESVRDVPTIGKIKSVFWGNNQYDQGFEGVLDRFRASNKQKDWLLNLTTELPKTPKSDNSFNYYLDPISNQLIIETAICNQNSTFDVINSIGQVIYSGKLSEKTFVNTEGFAKGIYVVKLNVLENTKFIKILKK